jgi:hypothetical protein
MSDSLNLNDNGDFSFRFDQTRFKFDKFHSTSSDDSNFDEFNNITNQKVLAHSSPIPMSNLQRFKGKIIENECERNQLDENNVEENDHEKINIKLGLRPIKRNNVIFNSYEELMEKSDKYELDEEVSNKDFNKKNIKMSLIDNKGEEQNFKPKPYENKSVRLSLQESTIDAYKANKKWIDYDNLENYEKLRKSFQELNFNEYSNKRCALDDSGLRRDDDSYLSEFDEVFLNDTKNDYSRNSKWSKINSHGSDSYDENSLQLESSINTNSISSDELSINEHINNKLTNLEPLNLNKSNNSKTEDDLHKGLVCYYNDYIKSEYKSLGTLSPTQSQNFDEFVESLIESTRNIDMNNNDLSRNSETESINTSKTRSLLFFLEGFESSSCRPFLKSINDASFKSSVSSVNAVNNKKNYSDLKDLEFILMSYFKRLKEVSNDSYLVSYPILFI